MKTITYILLIPVDNNDRKQAEHIENTIFKNNSELTEVIENKFEDTYYYSLSDFVDACNDQEINLENYWLSYIHILVS